MSKTPIPKTVELIVKGHNRSETSGKEPEYKVTLKTPKKHDPQFKLDIKTNSEILHEDFPLERRLTLTLTQPQKTLIE